MPSGNGGVIAITGANGAIGYYSALHALRNGCRVRCIVRRDSAIATIKSGPSIQEFDDRIEYAVVPDNTVPGAYDDALNGVRYVVHVAGVWPMPGYHPDRDIYDPFVKGMENILSAAEKSGTVKRIVFTQAGAGLVCPDEGDTLGTEMNNVLDEYAKVNDRSAAFRPPLKSPHHAYCGAKAYCMTHLSSPQTRANLPFSIIQIIPGTVIGPSELITSAAQAKRQMDRMSLALLFNGMQPRYAFGFVHVLDCARVHVEALDEEKVPEERVPDWFIAAATSKEGITAQKLWKEVGEMVEMEFGSVYQDVFCVGKSNWPVNMPFRVHSRLTEEMLMGERRFRGLEECVREVARWYIELIERESLRK
ncbi:NAD(P)-binding protein [Lojkania enalia]|uniref:NAD(P)-binding protein n=1 Tax=Lojkania enalia TaxID=147567 RepID=A0A9P4MX10_9PLEO|nr:NAD(P)-binding protein [Didymosphaeria enalia]